ncbi:spore germination protein [Sporolactobacillus sp. CPB3-1]|uniref:Spore germination protein n=1 Tax=Sporolactobacillus mangiferae TaxID=2940498 RepID=A0ABT0M759_9BACL|nr:GerAB/ArcD/ProY family transporter [Sporolactobacillus mangiferae]MCL1630669.1 spore germination protein [Sporolactobacillus mangiferae]
MAAKISEASKIGPTSAFFIPQAMQVGVGFISFQQIVTDSPEQDGWISVLINGLATLFVMWTMLSMLENEKKYGQADLFSLQCRLLGKRIGNIMNIVILCYICFYTITYLRGFIEILQVEVFPQLSTFYFSLMFCFIIWYVVMGGIRNIFGTCLLSFIYAVPVFLSLLFIIPHAHFSNLLPIMEHSPRAILSSSFMATHEFLGFEYLMFFYPFIKQTKHAKRWAYFGLLNALYIHLAIIIVTITFFSQGALQATIWPTMTYWKSIHFPLFEHIDIIFCIIMLWNLIPSTSVCSWAMTRGIKSICPKIKMKYSIYGILILIILITSLIQNGEQIKEVHRLLVPVGFIVVYLYIPFLSFIQWLKKRLSGDHT